MLCNVVVVVPVIHAASHFDHKKRVAWVPVSMHMRGPISITMELRYYMTIESKIMAYDCFNGSSSRDKIPIKKKPIGMLVFTLRLT